MCANGAIKSKDNYSLWPINILAIPPTAFLSVQANYGSQSYECAFLFELQSPRLQS